MGVLANEERAIDSLTGAVFHNCLGGSGDVSVIESAVERGAAVTRRAEDDHLIRVRRIGGDVVVGRQHGIDIDEVGFLGRFPSTFMSHAAILSPTGAPQQITAGNNLVNVVLGHDRQPSRRGSVGASG